VHARARRAARAAELGLVAKWSKKFGFVSVHDPTTGTWHDLPTKATPSWAKWEAGTRKHLYRSGQSDAFELNASHSGDRKY
jgi:hypothetical protein